MAKSLLAHLYSHIKGSQEDVATLALQYILSQSPSLNQAFTKCLTTEMGITINSALHYVCLVVGENKERPDMVGMDEAGEEILLCEMKFYAALTPNQPLAYIDRLKSGSGMGLVFVCPVRRRANLWSRLKESCTIRTVNVVGDYCLEVDGIRLAVITWAEILELLTKVAASVAVEMLSDIQQLEGFCAQMDSDAFIPFEVEDLSAEIAVKAERYYEIVDKTIELFRCDEELSTSSKGIKATAYRKGYTRSIYVEEFTLTLNYDRELWKSTSSIETPFWVSIRDAQWEFTDRMTAIYQKFPTNRRTKELWSMYFLALTPLVGASLDEVCLDLKRQIMDYIDVFRQKE